MILLQKELSHTITLHPSYFGPNMQDKIREKLYADVEGTCSGRYGYVVTVVSISRLEKGKVLPGSGLAEFKVTYQAFLFKPFKGEVLDGIVTTVNKVMCQLNRWHNLTFEKKKMGFFVDVGPLQVFVSSHVRLEDNII